MKKGRLIVISGPSGVGKGTVVKALMARDPNVRLSVSATTRDMRPNEIDGVHYYFITRERFEQMIAEDRFLEHACYVNNYYGTPEEPVDRLLAEGHDVILEIEVQGALQIMQRRPEAISVFIAAPSFEVLAARLRGRATQKKKKFCCGWSRLAPSTVWPRSINMWSSTTVWKTPWTICRQSFGPKP